MNKKVSDAVPHLQSRGMKAPKAEAMDMDMPKDVRANKLQKEDMPHHDAAQAKESEAEPASSAQVRQPPSHRGNLASSAEAKSSMPHNAMAHQAPYYSGLGEVKPIQGHSGSPNPFHDTKASDQEKAPAESMNEGGKAGSMAPDDAERKRQAKRAKQDPGGRPYKG